MKDFNLFSAKFIAICLVAIPLFFIGCMKDKEFTEVNKPEINEIEIMEGYDIEPIEGQYIIVLSESPSAEKLNLKYSEMLDFSVNDLVSDFSEIRLGKENIVQTYGYALNGFTARLSDEQLTSLRVDPRVRIIEQDYLIISKKPSWAGGGDDETAMQETPWGITRVNGVENYTGNGVAWIIDTGVDLDHPDLNVDLDRSKSFLGGKDANDPDDANGHGTHVAGTVAAINNEIGVVGVAPGATVVSVRVLNRRGSGTYSGVISGVDYVAANGKSGDVANMSLTGGVSSAMDAAVAAASVNVKFCLAAGNESDDANNYSPARTNGSNIYTVSASDVNNYFAGFSNYGNPPIDYCAPGVGVKSTWKNGGYNTISGTSMATPHVAGVLLLGSPSHSTTVNGDPDGNADLIITH